MHRSLEIRSKAFKSTALAAVAAMTMGSLALVQAPESYALDMPGEDDTRECTNVVHVVAPKSADESATGDPSDPQGLLGDISKSAGGDAPEGVFSTISIYYDPDTGLDGEKYQQAINEGTDNGVRLLQNIMEGCSQSQIIVSGEEMGADIAGNILSAAGNGEDGLSSDRVVGGLLFGDSKRDSDSPIISDEDGEALDRPESSSDNIQKVSSDTVSGGGITGSREQGFGDIQGNVASFCNPDDALCSSSGDQQEQMINRFGQIVFSGVAAGAPAALAGNPEAGAAAAAGAIGVDAMNLLTDMSGLPRINISPRTISMIVNLAVIAFQVSTGALPPTPGQLMQAVGDVGHLPGAISEVAGTVAQLPAFIDAAPDALPTLLSNLGLSSQPAEIQDQIKSVESGVDGADFNAVSGSYLPSSGQKMITDAATGDIEGMSEIAADPEMAKGTAARAGYADMPVGEEGQTSSEWSTNYLRELIKENG